LIPNLRISTFDLKTGLRLVNRTSGKSHPMPDTAATFISAESDPGRVESLARAQAASTWLFLMRLGVLAAILATALAPMWTQGTRLSDDPRAQALYAVALAAGVLNVIFLGLQRFSGAYIALTVAQIFADVALTSAVVLFTEGVRSPFISLYFASILTAALALHRGLALAVASAATISLSVVVLAIGPAVRSPGEVPFLVAQSCAFFLVAFLAGNLARRLAVSRLLSREILQAVGQGILVTDTAGIIVFCNNEAQRLLGLASSPAEKPLADVLPARAAAGDNEGSRIDIDMAAHGGEPMPVRIVTFPVRSGPDRVIGKVAVLTDLTTERRMEDALRQIERSKVMGEMAASIAHELRNPLSSIRGSVQEIARIKDLPENKRLLMEIVVQESDRLDRIISDFLNFARMRPVRKVRCNLADILLETQMLLDRRRDEGHPAAKRSKIDIRVPEGGLPAYVDAEQVRQVVMNLGINALDALDGAGAVTISARSASFREYARLRGLPPKADLADQTGVLIEVADDGPGMDAETRERVFDPFFTTKQGGSGLGLAVVQRVVMGHGGSADVTSAPGKGAHFNVWLPS
jgi:two-component system, NtrC family, sensor histidine kinase PilS